MDSLNNTDSKTQSAGRYLTFQLSKERYGMELLRVQEIICVPNITKVPRCAEFIKGIINLRGKIVPLLDLRLKFSLPPAKYDDKTCVIVVSLRKEDQQILLGVIVDTVLEVINFTETEIETAPIYDNQVDSHYIIGMGRKSDGDLNVLLDIEKALSDINLDRAAAV